MDIRRLKWVKTKSWDTLQEDIKVRNIGNSEELVSLKGNGVHMSGVLHHKWQFNIFHRSKLQQNDEL
jgi:hypothetical protein